MAAFLASSELRNVPNNIEQIGRVVQLGRNAIRQLFTQHILLHGQCERLVSDVWRRYNGRPAACSSPTRLQAKLLARQAQCLLSVCETTPRPIGRSCMCRLKVTRHKLTSVYFHVLYKDPYFGKIRNFYISTTKCS